MKEMDVNFSNYDRNTYNEKQKTEEDSRETQTSTP